MKTTLLFALMFVATFSQAQITLNQSNFAQAGDMFVMANDSNCSASKGNAGASQTYNLAALNNHYQDTVWYVNTAGQPGAANFPTANLAQKTSDGLGGFEYVYMQVTPNYADMVGYYDGANTISFNPGYRVMAFPATYNTAFNGVNSIEFAYPFPVPPFDSMKVKITTNYSSLIDGWGNVTTPSGTRACLRQRMITVQTDSTFMHDSLTNTWSWDMTPPTPTTDTSYSWIGNMERSALANLSPASAQSPTASGAYLLLGPTAVTDVTNDASITLYPNPFNAETTLESANALHNASLTVYNSLGQPVQQMTALSGNRIHISRQGLATGMYYLHLTQDSKILAIRKLIITE